MSKYNQARLALAGVLCCIAIATTAHGQSGTVTTEIDGLTNRKTESLDIGFFEWAAPAPRGVLGGTLVRLSKPGDLPDHVLVIWYGGRDPVMVTENEPMVVFADDDLVRLPSWGRIAREVGDGAAVSETTAYRFSPDQLRTIARAGHVRIRIAARDRSLDCALTSDNLRLFRAFVDEVVGGR